MSDSPLISAVSVNCPTPLQNYPHILLAHGGGGRLMHQLIDHVFLPAFSGTQSPTNAPSTASSQHDATILTGLAKYAGARLAMTTDSYVVQPLFFPGGDIGSLAVHGTVNDLAMAGARPLYLSVGFILEEGLPMTTLIQVVQSMAKAAAACGVTIVTGDTKVVNRGKGDGIFINTTGIGVLEHDQQIQPQSVQPEDMVLVSGDLGRHGIAIMAAREGIEFETSLESDSAPVVGAVLALLEAGIEIHCLRDLTRGGLATTLHEIATARGVAIAIDEMAINIPEQVQGVCEILGLDPLYIANEGRFMAIVAPSCADQALAILQEFQPTASRIGTVADLPESLSNSELTSGILDLSFGLPRGRVILKSRIGADRILEMLSGEQLPRIC
ncbi:MAG: hydrogenase expression/formation protein HypE [Pseudanabaena sp. ELA607]